MLVSVLLLLLAASSSRAASFDARFLNLYPYDPEGNSTATWTFGGGAPLSFSCSCLFYDVCSVSIPYLKVASYVFSVEADNGTVLFSASHLYDLNAATVGATWLLARPNASTTAPAVVRVLDDVAYLNETNMGIVVNLYDTPLVAAQDHDRGDAPIASDVPPLFGVTALLALPSLADDTIVFTLTRAGRYAFAYLEPANDSLNLIAVFPLPEPSVVVCDLTLGRARRAANVPLPGSGGRTWPLSVLIIASVLGVLGLVALVSCVITWYQDCRLARADDGYEPI